MTVGQLAQITLPVIKYCGGGTPLTLLCTQFFFPPFAHAGENFSCLDTSTHRKNTVEDHYVRQQVAPHVTAG